MGVARGQFSYLLSGSGRAFGIRFTPAGFRPFTTAAVASLTDTSVDLERHFGVAGVALESTVLAAPDIDAMARAADAWLRDRPSADHTIDAVNALVRKARDDPAINQVRQLAQLAGTSERQLQRRFREYVGVGPKWVIQRSRLDDAIEQLTGPQHGADLARLALELGYADQAHFIHEFKAAVSVTPAAYRRTDSPG